MHRFEMDPPLLQIYPANMKLTKQQQHAALYALAQDMQSRGGEDLAQFTRIALYEMAALYEQEAQRSGAGAEGKSLAYRWTDTTMGYAHELYSVADAITSATPIEISVDAADELMLIIDDRPWLLSSPVLDEPLLLDDRIIERACRELYCDTESTARPQTSRRAIVINADWLIEMNKPPEYVTDTGLHFVFSNLDRRSEKQIACLKIIREIELLAGSLRDAVSTGVTVEQDKLAIQSLYGSYDYRVLLNRFGDSLHVKLPELHHVQDWSTQLLPWLRDRMAGRITEHYLQADAMLSYTLH